MAARRRDLDWSLDAASANLKIARRHLLAMEQDRWEDLPGAAWVVGFARAYAEELGLDAADAAREAKTLVRRRQPVARASVLAGSGPGRGWMRVVLPVLLSVAIGVALATAAAAALHLAGVLPLPGLSVSAADAVEAAAPGPGDNVVAAAPAAAAPGTDSAAPSARLRAEPPAPTGPAAPAPVAASPGTEPGSAQPAPAGVGAPTATAAPAAATAATAYTSPAAATASPAAAAPGSPAVAEIQPPDPAVAPPRTKPGAAEREARTRAEALAPLPLIEDPDLEAILAQGVPLAPLGALDGVTAPSATPGPWVAPGAGSARAAAAPPPPPEQVILMPPPALPPPPLAPDPLAEIPFDGLPGPTVITMDGPAAGGRVAVSASAAQPAARDAVPTARLDVGPIEGEIKLIAQRPVTLTVRAETGEVLVARRLEQGEYYAVPDRDDLSLSLDNAGAIVAWVGARRLPPLGTAGESLRDIPLTEAGLADIGLTQAGGSAEP